jgi:hypothetical protein
MSADDDFDDDWEDPDEVISEDDDEDEEARAERHLVESLEGIYDSEEAMAVLGRQIVDQYLNLLRKGYDGPTIAGYLLHTVETIGRS